MWEAGGEIRAHFMRHPVISLSFKDVKAATWGECLEQIRRVVADELRRHAHVAEGLDGQDRAVFEAAREFRSPQADLERTLAHLSRWLHVHHGARVVILVDEYDTPVHAGFAHGYYDEVTSFLRGFLSAGLKDNEHLLRGVLTGILRVAKEGIFSGLNNVKDYGILDPRFASCFGLLEPEVERLMRDVGAPERMDVVRQWYDGYRFGDGLTVYNPWSVLNYAADLPRFPEPYWKNTSGNDVLRELILGRQVLEPAEVEELLRGGSVWKVIDKHVVLREAYSSADAAWGLLLFSGYLNAVEARAEPTGRIAYRLALPNREVHIAFADAIGDWTSRAVRDERTLPAMLEAMLAGDAATFGDYLGAFVRDVLSYHDAGTDRPERVFHAFLLGMLVQLQPRWQVRSNREAGHGRADVLVIPAEAGGPGAVVELKRVRTEDGETPEQALDAALAQVADRDYAAEVRASGAGQVWVWGAALDGKRVWVRRG